MATKPKAAAPLMADPPTPIKCTPTSPRAVLDVCRIELGTLDAATPVYLVFKNGTTEVGRSYPFVGSSDGKHEFNSYIWPSAGSCSITIQKVSDDSAVGDPLSVTVQ